MDHLKTTFDYFTKISKTIFPKNSWFDEEKDITHRIWKCSFVWGKLPVNYIVIIEVTEEALCYYKDSGQKEKDIADKKFERIITNNLKAITANSSHQNPAKWLIKEADLK